MEGRESAKNKMADDAKIEELKRNIAEIEKNLETAKMALFELTGEQRTGAASAPLPGMRVSPDGKVIEGTFNGENMVGPEGKIFPVPANYASKSKLVAGDRLKLTVAEDGSFIFKQIGPVERKNIVGELSFSENAYYVLVEGHRYNLLYAAVTYHKAKPGDKVTIVVPADGSSDWAAFENIIHDVSTSQASPQELTLGPDPQAPEAMPAIAESPILNQGTIQPEVAAAAPIETNALGDSVPTDDNSDAKDMEI